MSLYKLLYIAYNYIKSLSKTPMATIPYIQILIAFTCLLAFLWPWISKNKNPPAATNWPVLGMLPTLVFNLKNFHDNAAKILKQSGGTIELKGPWFCNMDLLLTCDPINNHYMSSKMFSNYPKGPEFRAIYEPFGDGILTADGDSWDFQRKIVHSFFGDSKFQVFQERTVQEHVAKRLYPVLDHVCERDVEVNLSDVIQRLGFDIICSLILGCDPKCLSVDFPEVAHERAINELSECVLYRNLVPEKFWKLMKRLQLGQERKLSAALKTFDRFVYQCIESKKSQMENHEGKEGQYDFLTVYLTKSLVKEGDCGARFSNPTKFLRDMATNLAMAGRDTSSAGLSWLFWLLARNPSVENKIIEEIKQNIDLQNKKEDGKRSIFSAEEVNKLVYLHATLCETLRLYPPIPANHKSSLQPDTLPSGHNVGANMKIFISHYAMGRMEDIWGKDCLEFKPERWVSDKGSIVHVPSYKFSAFSSGPRSCPGKNMSFVHMKIVAVAIILKYTFHIVEDHPMEPCNLAALHMKHGLKARVTKKSLI